MQDRTDPKNRRSTFMMKPSPNPDARWRAISTSRLLITSVMLKEPVRREIVLGPRGKREDWKLIKEEKINDLTSNFSLIYFISLYSLST